ncbi:MAG: transglycosylase SLT domain-containing protein, partial [bacterium]|nr:transglycosylase SLT domain-containing protein [bacterium]
MNALKLNGLPVFKRLVPLLLLLCGMSHAAEVFTTPENLRDNVAFWKKIYTEITLKEGIIHDRDYPLIIYKTITIGKMTGRKRRNYLRGHMRIIKQQLNHIRNKPSTQWTAKEQEIAGLFRKYASMAEVKGAGKRIRFQQGQRDRFKEGLERSGAYLPYILAVFIEHKIPPRIAYLPHVESSFNPRAYSRVGAAGMWQFMRGTGRMFLRVNYRVDERLDPFKATVAAAKLLRKNYTRLKSWPLAITAYNHGLASISRAVRVTGSRDLGVIIDKYKNRRFKFASKNFYGCFLAASEIAASPYKYFKNIAFHSPPKYHEIELKKYYRPKTLSKYLGMSEGQIKALNPSLRSIVYRRRLSIPKGYILRIPASLSPETARQRLGGVKDTPVKASKAGRRYYSVKRGDTLYRIARRFRVSAESLIVANEIAREDRIYIGQVLRIPGNIGTKTAKKTGNSRVRKTQTVKSTAAQTVTTKPVPGPAKPGNGITLSPSTTTASKEKATSDIETKAAVDLPVSSGNPAVNVKTGTGTAGVKKDGVSKPNYRSIFDATLYNREVSPRRSDRQAVVKVTLNETLGHYADWLGTSVRRLRRLNSG